MPFIWHTIKVFPTCFLPPDWIWARWISCFSVPQNSVHVPLNKWCIPTELSSFSYKYASFSLYLEKDSKILLTKNGEILLWIIQLDWYAMTLLFWGHALELLLVVWLWKTCTGGRPFVPGPPSWPMACLCKTARNKEWSCTKSQYRPQLPCGLNYDWSPPSSPQSNQVYTHTPAERLLHTSQPPSKSKAQCPGALQWFVPGKLIDVSARPPCAWIVIQGFSEKTAPFSHIFPVN